MSNYENHRLHNEFIQLRSDDAVFFELFKDTEEDFFSWVFDYEIDSDWENKL